MAAGAQAKNSHGAKAEVEKALVERIETLKSMQRATSDDNLGRPRSFSQPARQELYESVSSM